MTNAVVQCVRVADVPRGEVPSPGVGVVRCSGCRAKLYASAESRRLARRGARFVCTACLPPGALLMTMTPDQVKELRGWLAADANN